MLLEAALDQVDQLARGKRVQLDTARAMLRELAFAEKEIDFVIGRAAILPALRACRLRPCTGSANASMSAPSKLQDVVEAQPDIDDLDVVFESVATSVFADPADRESVDIEVVKGQERDVVLVAKMVSEFAGGGDARRP